MRSKEIVERDHRVLSPALRLKYYPLVVARARGAKVWDVDGNEYIDFLSGAAVTNVGHNHPKVVEAISRQLQEFIHYASLYMYYELPVKLAEELAKITLGNFPKRVAYGLSGSDANDSAIKYARAFTRRPKIISFFNSYHGQTYGATSLSAVTIRMSRRIGPLLPEIYHVHYPDCYRCPFKLECPECGYYCIDYIEKMFKVLIPSDEVAGIFVEPIQGDAGVIVPPELYHRKLKELCEKYGILFVAEEVQTGFARTGKWFAMQHFGVNPDLTIMGKAIAAGMPLSALIGKGEIFESMEGSMHFYTTQAHPLSCAAALANIEIIREERLAERANRLGGIAMKRFSEMMEKHELIGDVRGKGLLIGVDLVKDRGTKEPARKEALKVDWRCWEKKMILTHFGASVLRIAPPLTISEEELEKALTIIEEAITDVEKGKVPDSVIQQMAGW